MDDPIRREALPRTARDIMNRVNEIGFNSSLVKELRAFAIVSRLAAEKGLDMGPYGPTYLHLIHVDTEVQDLAASSKLNAEWSYLQLLFKGARLGRRLARGEFRPDRR